MSRCWLHGRPPRLVSSGFGHRDGVPNLSFSNTGQNSCHSSSMVSRCRSMHFSESRVTKALISRSLHNAREQKDPTHFISVSFLTDVDCGQWLRLPCPLLLIFFLCLLPRCFAAPSHHSKSNFTCLLAARTACDKRPGTSWKSFLGQFRPLIWCGSPHLDKLLLPGPRWRQGRPESASPTRLRLNQLEELSMAKLMSLGAVDHPVHQSSSQTYTYHYQTLIIRH